MTNINLTAKSPDEGRIKKDESSKGRVALAKKGKQIPDRGKTRGKAEADARKLL